MQFGDKIIADKTSWEEFYFGKSPIYKVINIQNDGQIIIAETPGMNIHRFKREQVKRLYNIAG